jgi:hypothetical protein
MPHSDSSHSTAGPAEPAGCWETMGTERLQVDAQKAVFAVELVVDTGFAEKR